MAEPNDLKLDKDTLKQAFSLSNFDINAVLRGVQLTLVGGKSITATILRGLYQVEIYHVLGRVHIRCDLRDAPYNSP